MQGEPEKERETISKSGEIPLTEDKVGKKSPRRPVLWGREEGICWRRGKNYKQEKTDL